MTHPTVSLEEALALKPLIVGKAPKDLSPVLTAAAEVLRDAHQIELLSYRDRPTGPETIEWGDTGAPADPGMEFIRAATKASERLTKLWSMDCGASHAAFRILQMVNLGTGRIHIDDLLRLDRDNREAAIHLLDFALKCGTEAMAISPGLRTALINEQIRVGKLKGFNR